MTNAGYQLIHRIDIGDKHFVTGHNPKAPAPYATWQYFEDRNYFYNGHYFTEQDAAIVDMFKRAGEELNLQNGYSLGLALLNDDDRMNLREESDREAVYYALDDLLSDDEHNYDYEALINDPIFMARAVRLYNNIDHSYENEAFAQTLEELLEEFPQHKSLPLQDLQSELKISPEQAKLVNDLLTLPAEKVIDKYGPLGDNISFDFDLADGFKAVIEITPRYETSDPKKLSMKEPHTIHVSVLDPDGKVLGLTPTIQHYPDSESSLSGQFHISLGNCNLTLILVEDEALRREGNQFIFHSSSSENRYTDHNGELCKILRALTSKECDILCVGLMWEAEFPNGEVLHVFDDELQLPEKGERKPALEDLVQNAASRQTQQSQQRLAANKETREL